MKNTALTNKSCRALTLLCTYALILLCVPASVNAIELPKTAKLVPPETIVLADINNFSQLWAQFEKTNFYQLYKDPAMAPLINNFKTKWREQKQESEREYLRIITDAGVLPQGRVAVALIYDQQVKDVNELPVLAVIQWGDKIDKVKELADKIVRKAIEDGARRQTDDYRGVETVTIEKKPVRALSYCFIDDCLIGSTSPNILRFVIAQIKGAGSTTLGDDRDYNATLNAIDPTNAGRIDLYVNIKGAVKIELAEDTTGKAGAMIDNIGLNNVISFGCCIEPAGGPGGSSFGKAILKIDGAKTGIFKMLEIESGPIRMPRFIAASACSVSVVNLNIRKAFGELTNILTRFSPQMASIIYMPILPPGPNGEPGLQLKADIIDHLGSQIILAHSIDKPQPEAGAGRSTDKKPPLISRSVVAIAIENRAAFEKSLSMIHSKMIAPNNPDARRELLGYTIYSIDISGLLPMLGGPPARKPMQAPAAHDTPKIAPSAFTVTDTHMLFASESAVEQAIRTLASNQTESISSARWFNKAKSNIPSAVGMASLQDNAASGELLWSTLRQSKKPDKSDDDKKNQITVGVTTESLFPRVMFSQTGDGLLDFSLLPEYNVVKKHLGIYVFYGISRQDGFFFEFKYLSPTASE